MKEKIEKVIQKIMLWQMGSKYGLSSSVLYELERRVRKAAYEIARQVVSRDEHEAETAILGNRVFKAEAKLAVMGEALTYIAEFNIKPDSPGGAFHLQNKAREALSAAPKVEWVGRGDIEHTLLADYTYTTILCPTHIGKNGQQHPVIVLAREENDACHNRH